MEKLPASFQKNLISGLPASGYYVPNIINQDEEAQLLREVGLSLLNLPSKTLAGSVEFLISFWARTSICERGLWMTLYRVQTIINTRLLIILHHFFCKKSGLSHGAHFENTDQQGPPPNMETPFSPSPPSPSFSPILFQHTPWRLTARLAFKPDHPSSP